MRREIFTEEHELFRAQVRRFVEKEIEPKVAEWNRAGISDRDSWRKLGAAGYLGANAPAEFGGAGADFLYDAIVIEELTRVRAHGLTMGAAFRHLHAVHQHLRQRRAEASLADRRDQRRD